MRYFTAKRNGITVSICLFFLLFALLGEFRALKRSKEHIRQHAAIIADDVWNVNMRSTEEYLRVAAITNRYDQLTVYDSSGEIFRAATGNPPTLPERMLRVLRLSPQVFLHAPVEYANQHIGTIEARYHPRTAVITIQILLFLVMLTAMLHMYLRSLYDQSLLEERIKARTEELARSNRILLHEIHQKKKTAQILRQNEKEYKQLYQQAKSAEELYRSLIDSSADAILICDLDSHVQDASTAFSALFGYLLDDVRGQPFDMFADQDKTIAREVFTDIRENGSSYQGYELTALTRSGELLDISLSGSRFNDHQGNPTGMLFVIRDMSYHKKMEKQLQRMERLEAVGTLAGGIAHDFNNLLMGIQGNTSLALLDAPRKGDMEEKLRAIEHYVESGQELTARLLGFARGGKYETRPIDLNLLCREEIRLFARTRKDLSLNESYQDGLWTVEADRGQIRQVLLNLFVNSGQAMTNGGTLCLATANTVLDTAAPAGFEIRPGRYVQLTVRDTGHGMDQQTLDRIFDPFFTTKEIGRGTGLGLASAYGIIKNHSGHIDVSSTPGAGTTFVIYLPASDKTVAPPEAAAETIKARTGEETILLVEDEELVRDVARQMLEVLGFHVIASGSGREACALYAQQPDHFAAVILDMIMPDMDGGAVFQQLKTVNPAVRVLLSSGYAMNDQAQRIMDEGCSGFLQKPFNIVKLSEKLNHVLLDA